MMFTWKCFTSPKVIQDECGIKIDAANLEIYFTNKEGIFYICTKLHYNKFWCEIKEYFTLLNWKLNWCQTIQIIKIVKWHHSEEKLEYTNMFEIKLANDHIIHQYLLIVVRYWIDLVLKPHCIHEIINCG